MGWVFYINIYLKTSYRDKIEAADFNLVVDKLRARYGTAQVTFATYQLFYHYRNSVDRNVVAEPLLSGYYKAYGRTLVVQPIIFSKHFFRI